MTNPYPHLQPQSDMSDPTTNGTPQERRPVGVWLISLYLFPWSLSLIYVTLLSIHNDPTVFDVVPLWQLYQAIFNPSLLLVGTVLFFKLSKPCILFFLSYLILSKYEFVFRILMAGGGIQKLQTAFHGHFGTMFVDFIFALIPVLYSLHLYKMGVLKKFRS